MDSSPRSSALEVKEAGLSTAQAFRLASLEMTDLGRLKICFRV